MDGVLCRRLDADAKGKGPIARLGNPSGGGKGFPTVVCFEFHHEPAETVMLGQLNFILGRRPREQWVEIRIKLRNFSIRRLGLVLVRAVEAKS